MDRASTIRFYDHYGHVSAAVCYQNTLHARTGDGRLDHARTHEPRRRKGVNLYPKVIRISYHYQTRDMPRLILNLPDAAQRGSLMIPEHEKLPLCPDALRTSRPIGSLN